jgi:methanogenic corrinoid protein MtbC1
VLAGDRLKASDLLVSAVELGAVSALECYERILAPVQRELGKRWREGVASIADERVGLESARMVLDRLYPRVRGARSSRRVVVVACVQGNTHELGARMVADIFEASGWKAVYLGADVPAEEVALAAAGAKAHVVALSVASSEHVDAASRTIAALRRLPTAPRTLVGGPAFSDAGGSWQETGADAHAATAREAVEAARNLVA